MRAIVTRPEEEARSWVERLRAHGIEAAALPLIRIAGAPDLQALHDAWARLGQWRAAMFVSGNAVRHFFAAAPAEAHFTIQAWAPGPGTAQALRDAGVEAARIHGPDGHAQQFDSQTLWDQVGAQVRPGDRVLIVRGANGDGAAAGRDWLAQQVAAAGAATDAVSAYTRLPPAWGASEQRAAQAAATDGSVWLFSSSEAVANLRALVPSGQWSHARALATHPRIAQAATQAGFGQVIACRPAFDEVLASLQSAR